MTKQIHANVSQICLRGQLCFVVHHADRSLGPERASKKVDTKVLQEEYL